MPHFTHNLISIRSPGDITRGPNLPSDQFLNNTTFSRKIHLATRATFVNWNTINVVENL